LSQKKNILIVSFFFPPYKRVGGRRWAKFAKYLVRNGHAVKILCAQLSNSDTSPWDRDVEPFEKEITRIPVEHKVPYFKGNMSPASFLGKIRYRLSMLSYKNRLRSIAGDMNDLSIGSENLFANKAEELIKQFDLRNLVLSGGPFRYITAVAQLKRKYPTLNLIIDLRDFWSDNMTTLSPERRGYEEKLEQETLLLADHIITPAERIQSRIAEKYPQLKAKIKVIPHGYDPDDFGGIESVSKKPESVFKLIYAGSLYAEMQSEMQTLANLIGHIKKSGVPVMADLYTFQTDYKHIFTQAGLDENVKYHFPIDSKELFNKISEDYDAVLVLLSGRAMTQHFKSSKFYELVYLKKPIVYIGPQGDVSDFTEEKQLGFYVNPKTIIPDAERILSNWQTCKIPTGAFSAEDFSYEKVAGEFEKILA
jgi:glycosyltransferase involved in cell wall biosynthesis